MTNISRNKGNQTIKLVQLIEYNMRNIFVEKFYKKRDGQTIPRLFYKKIKFDYISGSMDQSFIQFVLLYANLRAIET